MNKSQIVPDHTAIRVALWRALHLKLDAKPYVFQDEVGLKIANPDKEWEQRPDMHPIGTRGYRASIVGRARLIEDLLLQEHKNGVNQYVILGAGLDTFAQRYSDLLSSLHVFEIDKNTTQQWKINRLKELGFLNTAKEKNNLHFVPVNFESGELWWKKLAEFGLNFKKPAIISSTGVSMYLTKEANAQTLEQVAKFAPGSTLALAFMLPLELIPEAERPGHQMVYEKAKAAGTPFVSFYRPEEMLTLAKSAGFKKVSHISREEIINRYFINRSDGLEPSTGEEFLIATC